MRSRPSSDIVLITGAGSGIGHASAQRLHAAGFTVYATARKAHALNGLAAGGIRTMALDVADEKSMQTAVSAIEAEAGAIRILINNAAYGLYGHAVARSFSDLHTGPSRGSCPPRTTSRRSSRWPRPRAGPGPAIWSAFRPEAWSG